MSFIQTSRSTSKHAKRRTQLDRREAAEKKLLDAAIRLIAKHGLRKTTLGDVAEAAGFSRSLTAHHYKSKNKLIKAVVTEIRRRFANKMERIDSKSTGLSHLTFVIEAYLKGAGTDESYALHIIQKEALTESTEFRTVMRAYNRDSIKQFARHIEAGKEAGNVRPDIDANVHATLLLASLRGLQAQWLLSPNLINIEKTATTLVAHLKRSLGSQSSTV